VISDRELETIIQFVTGTSIHLSRDTRICEFDVYDITQATSLMDYLKGFAMGLMIELVLLI
jgi:hypothetical protein